MGSDRYRADSVDPDFDAFLAVEEALAGPLAEQIRLPLLRARERGVIGWCVDARHCLELTKSEARPLNHHDLPVGAASLAFRDGRLSFEGLYSVLAAYDQLMKPGDELVSGDDDGHFYFLCWCGHEGRLWPQRASAERELEDHRDGWHS